MDDLIQALAVTAELTGSKLSEGAATVMVQDLAGYPRDQILVALQRCRRELKGRLTIAEVLSRLDDGRPGPEEAWAMLPFNEDMTVVWTDEMARAWGVAMPLFDLGDKVGARFAFKEAYQREVSKGRDARRRPHWTPSLGQDRHGREVALVAAVEAGRLGADHVRKLLPSPSTVTLEQLTQLAYERAEVPRLKG